MIRCFQNLAKLQYMRHMIISDIRRNLMLIIPEIVTIFERQALQWCRWRLGRRSWCRTGDWSLIALTYFQIKVIGTVTISGASPSVAFSVRIACSMPRAGSSLMDSCTLTV